MHCIFGVSEDISKKRVYWPYCAEKLDQPNKRFLIDLFIERGSFSRAIPCYKNIFGKVLFWYALCQKY